MKTVWIPEAPNMPGPLYAAADGVTERNKGKIQFGTQAISTYSVEDARQFATSEACEAWCRDNPKPLFVPTEHGFMEKDDA